MEDWTPFCDQRETGIPLRKITLKFMCMKNNNRLIITKSYNTYLLNGAGSFLRS